MDFRKHTSAFFNTDIIAEVIILTKINPIEYSTLIESISVTQSLIVVEEGSKYFGVGSEIISGIMERINFKIKVQRIGALQVPIPSVKSLECQVLPNINTIINTINN